MLINLAHFLIFIQKFTNKFARIIVVMTLLSNIRIF